MANPYDVVRQFESALCEYTGAEYAVTTTSCTSALLLAVAWYLRQDAPEPARTNLLGSADRPYIEIPKRTYVSVPMSIIHAGGRPTFRDEDWRGAYQLKPLPVWDCARRFTSGMYGWTPQPDGTLIRKRGQFQCVSFHHTKILGLAAHGGAILHDNVEADAWLRRARFDGRTEGVAPKEDSFTEFGWHCYITPPTAAEGLLRLSVLPKHNGDLPNDDYPDLSEMEIWK